MAADTFAWYCVKIIYRKKVYSFFLAYAVTAPASGCSVNCSREAHIRRKSEASGRLPEECLDLRAALGNCSGFIKDNSIDPVSRFQGFTGFNQDAILGAFSCSGP